MKMGIKAYIYKWASGYWVESSRGCVWGDDRQQAIDNFKSEMGKRFNREIRIREIKSGKKR